MKTHTRNDLAAWYSRSTGGFLHQDARDSAMANLAFPKNASSSKVDWVVHTLVHRRKPVAHPSSAVRQLRELHAALSITKRELARVLRVALPTLSDWFDGGQPSAGTIARIHRLQHLLSQVGVSFRNPLFPQYIRLSVMPEHPALLELLCDDPIMEPVVAKVLRKAKAMGDEIHRRRENWEERLRRAGFSEPDRETRKKNLATNVALMPWPRT